MDDPFTDRASGQYNPVYQQREYDQQRLVANLYDSAGYPPAAASIYGRSQIPVFNHGYPASAAMYGNYNYPQSAFAQQYGQYNNVLASYRAPPYFALNNNQQGATSQALVRSRASSQLAVTSSRNPPIAVPLFALRDDAGQPIPAPFTIEQNAHVGVLHISQVSPSQP
jgi:hypothetical protein